MVDYTNPTSTGWGWSPNRLTVGTSFGSVASTPTAVPKSILRTFRQAIISDYPDSQVTLRNFTQAVITDTSPNIATLRTFRQVVITDTANNIATLESSTKATVYSALANTPNIRNAQKALVYTKATDVSFVSSSLKALLYTSVFNVDYIKNTQRGVVNGPKYDGLYLHNVVQSVLFDTIENSGFITAATKAELRTQIQNSVKLSAIGRAVLSMRASTDGVHNDYAAKGAIYAVVTDQLSVKQTLLTEIFTPIYDRLYLHNVAQSVIFDLPSDFPELKTGTSAYLYGMKESEVKLSQHTRAYLQLRLANGPPDTNPAYPYDPNDPTDPNNPLNPDNPNHNNDPGSLIPIIHGTHLSYSGRGGIEGAVTNALTLHNVVQSAIFEVNSTDTVLATSTKAETLSQWNNTTKLTTASRAVLWFSNRAYGRRRITYFA